ncbi:hypothetical protein BG004_007271 [Podila humilis]|nr:hypothetical protein BG004_007271 [Podila humilis]
MDRIDRSLEDIIQTKKRPNAPKKHRESNPRKMSSNISTKKGHAGIKTRAIQKNRTPAGSASRHIRKENALFTETFKKMTAPVKEIFTSRYVPDVGPIKMVAINRHPTMEERSNPRPIQLDVKKESAPGTPPRNVGRSGNGAGSGRSVYRPADSYRPSQGSRRDDRSTASRSSGSRQGGYSYRSDDDSRYTSNQNRRGERRPSHASHNSSEPSHKTERGPAAAVSTGMDVDIPLARPATIEPINVEDGPATIEIENLDPGTTAEDVQVVCSRFGEIKSCRCTNGFAQVTYARKPAALAAMQTLHGKTADNEQVLRVTMRKTPIFHDLAPVVPLHVPSPISEPLKMVGKTIQGSINQAGELYNDQLLAAQQMLKMSQDRMAQLHMEEQRLRSQQGNVFIDYSDKRHVVNALMQDLKEGGISKNWTEREKLIALQALKTLGRSTEGCDSMFTEEGNIWVGWWFYEFSGPPNLLGIRTLMYQSGLNKATEASIDKPGSKEALKCLANALLLKPATRPCFEKLEGHSQCSLLLKRPHLSNESHFLLCRILFLVTIDATSIVKSLLDEHHAVTGVGEVLKTQLARSPDGSIFSQSMVLSEALKYLFNLMIVDPKITRNTDADLTEEEKTAATGKRFQSLLPTIVSILTTIPPSSPNPLEPPHSHAIHVLLNFPISTSAILVTRSQQAALLNVLMQILDDTLRYSLNTDDEASTDGMSNGTELDEIVPPLVIVLTNIASVGGEGRAAMKSRLLPDDVDRSQPLEKGDTFSARLIRRMTSLRFPHIRETVCQLLYVVCNEDAALLTRHVGYGNAAGFLMNRNLGMPASMSGESGVDDEEGKDNSEDDGAAQDTVEELPSPTSAQSGPSSGSRSNGRRYSAASAVNPITGAYYPDPSAIRTAMADMTEEEKEEEAGRLLDMFDKLRRTGVIEVRNPALEAGLRQRERDRYYDEQERKEREEEGDDD